MRPAEGEASPLRFGPIANESKFEAVPGGLMKKKEYKQILSRCSEPVFGDFGQFWKGLLYKLAKSACILAFACIPALPLGESQDEGKEAQVSFQRPRGVSLLF